VAKKRFPQPLRHAERDAANTQWCDLDVCCTSTN